MHHLYALHFFVLACCLGVPRSQAQSNDPVGPLVPSVATHSVLVAAPGGSPAVQSPFKALTLERVAANGHKESGIVDVVFTAGNQSAQTASLVFSIDTAVSRAADDLDSLYPISQLRLGSTRKDSSDINAYVVILRPDQSLHCGLYLHNVPLTARYIRKVILFTKLSLDSAPQGEDNIIFANLPITWK